ncbi:MAG: terminase family protein [Patescibacteria group bacterium]|nr:terminase family protein [Patescibacteria group bacterium]
MSDLAELLKQMPAWMQDKLPEALAAAARIPYCPFKPHAKQRAFLALDMLGVREALYGGAAGGGKSICLCMAALKYVDFPEYKGLLIRKSLSDANKAEGLMDIMWGWLKGTKAKYDSEGNRWRFPSGAEIHYGYIDGINDHYNYAGSAYHFIGWDELTQFRQNQYEFVSFSRQRRRVDSSIPLVVRSTSNPGGVGHQWVFDRFVNPENTQKRIFLPATLEDNPSLDIESYDESLSQLSEVERQQLRHGNWYVKQAGLVYPDFDNYVEPIPPGVTGRKVGGIDWGWHNPFGCLVATLDHDDVLWVNFERHGSYITLAEHAKAIPYGCEYWCDPAEPSSAAELRLAGHTVTSCTHRGKDPREAGIAAVTARMRTGRLKFAPHLKELRKEAGKHVRGPNGEPIDKDNHLLAALRYMVVGLDRGHVVVQRDTEAIKQAKLAEEERVREQVFNEQQEQWMKIDNPAWWGDTEENSCLYA